MSRIIVFFYFESEMVVNLLAFEHFTTSTPITYFMAFKVEGCGVNEAENLLTKKQLFLTGNRNNHSSNCSMLMKSKRLQV